MKLITGMIYFIAAALAAYNSVNRQMDVVWLVIAVLFAFNGIRWIVKYIRDRKQSEEE